eukprot:694249-Pyramimonas_sp.AAC.1
MLLLYMRQRAVIAIQETHGNDIDMDLLASSAEHNYIAFQSALMVDGSASEAAGGIAFLIPLDRAEHRLPPEQRPPRSFRAIVPGRIGELRVSA